MTSSRYNGLSVNNADVCSSSCRLVNCTFGDKKALVGEFDRLLLIRSRYNGLRSSAGSSSSCRLVNWTLGDKKAIIGEFDRLLLIRSRYNGLRSSAGSSSSCRLVNWTLGDKKAPIGVSGNSTGPMTTLSSVVSNVMVTRGRSGNNIGPNSGPIACQVIGKMECED